MMNKAVKYIKEATNISISTFISDLSYKFTIPIPHCLLVFNALKTNRRLTLEVLSSVMTEDMESLYLQLIVTSDTQPVNMNALTTRLVKLLKIPPENKKYNMVEFVEMRDRLEHKDYDLSREQINNAIIKWGNDTEKILNQFNAHGVLDDDRFLDCTKDQALAIIKSGIINTKYKIVYDYINFKASNITAFNDSLKHANNIVTLCWMVVDTASLNNILEKYGKNPTVIHNLIKVMEINNKYSCAEARASALSGLFRTNFTNILSKHKIGETDIVKEKLAAYCLKLSDPVSSAKNFGTIVEDITEGYPFLKDTIERMRSIALEVYDEVVDIVAEKKAKEKEKKRLEREKEEKEKKTAELAEAVKMIETYIKAYSKDPISKVQYCVNNDIDKTEFNKNLNIVKYGDPELYSLYTECTNMTTVRALKGMSNSLKTVIKALNDNPDMSLYDYYNITKFDPAVLYRLSFSGVSGRRFSHDDRKLFQEFYNIKAKYSTAFSPGYFYNETYIIKDTTLTKKQKTDIISYMKKNRYPLNIPLFKEISRKYINGELDLNVPVVRPGEPDKEGSDNKN